jgi:sulfur carrier protein
MTQTDVTTAPPSPGAAGEALEVTVNGDRRRLPAGATVASLLAAHDLDPRLVVVELNREILRDRDAYPALGLAAGDTVEIVHFVGGG